MGSPPKMGQQSPNAMQYNVTGPVPVIWGKHRLKGVHLEHPIHQFDNVQQTYTAVYYTVFLALCHGPVDYFGGICVDGQWATGFFEDNNHFRYRWDGNPTGAHRTAGQAVHSATWQFDEKNVNAGFRLYWGVVSGAVHDPRLNGASNDNWGGRKLNYAPNIHGTYPGLCYVVLDPYETGYNTGQGGTSIGTLEVVVGRLADSGLNNPGYTIDMGESPLRILHEILTNSRWGMGLPASMVPTDVWNAAVQRMWFDGYAGLLGSATGLHAVLSSDRGLGEVISEICAYFGGYLRWENGQVIPDWVPAKSFTVPASTPTIDRSMMLEEPETEMDTWEDCNTEVQVDYTAIWNDFGECSVTARNPRVADILGYANKETFSGKWIGDEWIANLHAARLATAKGRPRRKGSCAIPITQAVDLASPPQPLRVGSLFYYECDSQQVRTLVRVTEMDDRGDGSVLLTFAEEPGVAQPIWDPSVGHVEFPLRPPPQIPAVPETWRLWELPFDLSDRSGAVAAVVLCANQPANSNLQLYLSPTGEFNGEETMRIVPIIATLITLVSGMNNSTTVIDVPVTTQLGVYGLGWDNIQAQDDTALVLVGDEVMSIGSFVSADETKRRYSVLRGRRGTAAVAHDADASGWQVDRDAVEQARFTSPVLRGASLGLNGSGNSNLVYARLSGVNAFGESAVTETQTTAIRTGITSLTRPQWLTDGTFLVDGEEYLLAYGVEGLRPDYPARMTIRCRFWEEQEEPPVSNLVNEVVVWDGVINAGALPQVLWTPLAAFSGTLNALYFRWELTTTITFGTETHVDVVTGYAAPPVSVSDVVVLVQGINGLLVSWTPPVSDPQGNYSWVELLVWKDGSDAKTAYRVRKEANSENQMAISIADPGNYRVAVALISKAGISGMPEPLEGIAVALPQCNPSIALGGITDPGTGYEMHWGNDADAVAGEIAITCTRNGVAYTDFPSNMVVLRAHTTHLAWREDPYLGGYSWNYGVYKPTLTSGDYVFTFRMRVMNKWGAWNDYSTDSVVWSFNVP
jgi:hypothetical protein